MGKLYNWLAGVLIAASPLLPGAARGEGGTELEKIGEEASVLTSEKKKSDADWLIFPIPVSSPSSGAGLVLAGVVFYNPNNAPTPWITGVGGILTENGTRGLGAFHSMSLDDDRIRLKLIGVYGNTKPRFYGVGAAAGDRNISVRLDERDILLRAQAQFRVADHFYVGPRLEYRSVKSRLQSPPDLRIDMTPVGAGGDLGSIGPALSFDTRDDSLNPSKGVYLMSFMSFNLEELGSDYVHNRFQIAANGYHAVSRNTVLAARASLCAVSRGAPYFDLCKFGASNDLRGYDAGRYRDRASWATQIEVRQKLTGRIGATAFAGLGGIATSLDDIGDSRLLPGGGVGFRYLVSKSNNVNLRLDFAVGRESKGIYVGIGEAF